jgi:N-acetyltransferase
MDLAKGPHLRLTCRTWKPGADALDTDDDRADTASAQDGTQTGAALKRRKRVTGMWENLTKVLEGEVVRLEPLAWRHEEGLFRVSEREEIWRWMQYGASRGREPFRRWIGTAISNSEAGTEGAFATLDARTGEPIGGTRFLALRPEHRGLEIGWTWLAPSRWGTGANVEAKLLMLEHAFEALGCMRVEFKTDRRNERSRNAIAALPARFEGIFRKHMILPNADIRDSAYYSIVDDEWPEVRANLERRLAEAGVREGAR